MNIGDRQKGRIVCGNIVCCKADPESIRAALQTALSPAFAEKARSVKSPFNGGDTSGRIVRRLEEFLASDAPGRPKGFYDGEETGKDN